MVDRTQLTEALAWLEQEEHPIADLTHHTALGLAARLLLDFPTDAQVEAARRALLRPEGKYRHHAVEALEAVRRVMFRGDDG